MTHWKLGYVFVQKQTSVAQEQVWSSRSKPTQLPGILDSWFQRLELESQSFLHKAREVPSSRRGQLRSQGRVECSSLPGLQLHCSRFKLPIVKTTTWNYSVEIYRNRHLLSVKVLVWLRLLLLTCSILPWLWRPSFCLYLCSTHCYLSHSRLLGCQLTGYQARITELVLL